MLKMFVYACRMKISDEILMELSKLCQITFVDDEFGEAEKGLIVHGCTCFVIV